MFHTWMYVCVHDTFLEREGIFHEPEFNEPSFAPSLL